MDLNKVTLIGHVATSPEHRTLTSGSSLTRTSVATNYYWKDKTGAKQEKVDFHNIIGWNRLGERMQEYLKTGDKVYIEGRIDYRTYQNKEGKTQHTTDIIAQRLIMLCGKKSTTAKVIDEDEEPTVEPLPDTPF